MAESTTKRQELKSELEALKKLADDQAHHFVKARQLLHEGLCRVYLLWREASKQQGLLEELYDECSIQYKRETIHDVTFSPLLRYLWGMDGTVNSNTIDQWNRALNALHIAVVSDMEYYKTNTLSKLVSYISTNGGITALAGYSPTPIDTAKESKSARKAKSDAFAEAKRQAEHLQRGKLFFATSAAALSKFQTGFTLPAADSGLSLALIRKTKSGYDLVGAIDDKEMIEEAIVTSYKRNSKPLPNTVKVLTEVIRTQTLPYVMRSMSSMLADSSKYKTDDGKTVMKQLKRLLYVASSGAFVLSANRSECSVVTVAKPTNSIIVADEDVALAVGDRTYIENNLIHGGDFNFYSADAADLIPKVEDETASHRLQLENTVTKRFRFIRLYPLSAFQFPPSKTQAVLRSDLQFEPTYTAKLDRKWIEEMNGKFLSRWVAGLGKQIKRAENVMLGLSLGKTGITIHSTFKAKAFKEFEILPFNSTAATKPINVAVLSRDIIPVLNALVQMEIASAVTLQADANMVQLAFKTDSAAYNIAIPCCDAKGKRIGTNFAAYGGHDGN